MRPEHTPYGAHRGFDAEKESSAGRSRHGGFNRDSHHRPPSSTPPSPCTASMTSVPSTLMRHRLGSSTNALRKWPRTSNRHRKSGQNRIIFVSGAPGAGKTLVGLKLAFDPRFRKESVFVTGNAPLVDVLSESLKKSYRPKKSELVISGYVHEQALQVIKMSTFKIVKAHAYLGERGKSTGSADGRVVIFDEAQRTLQEGSRRCAKDSGGG